MRTRRDAALRSLRFMLAASVVFPVLLFCYASWVNYHAAVEQADERIRQALDLTFFPELFEVRTAIGAPNAAY